MQIELQTTPGQGGIAVFEITGLPGDLAQLEEILTPLPAGRNTAETLQYRHILAADSSILDEVLYACPSPERRILTSHGGTATALAVKKRLESLADAEEAGRETAGLQVPERHSPAWFRAFEEQVRRDAAAILPTCRTETQAAFVAISAKELPGMVKNGSDQERADLVENYTFARNLLHPRRVVLVGPPNAGKSSLFNCILAHDRALVSETAGTTRDAVREWVDMGGYFVELVDTAGVGKAQDTLDRQAQARQPSVCDQSDLVVRVLDSAASEAGADSMSSHLTVWNKTDLLAEKAPTPGNAPSISLSCLAPGAAVSVFHKAILPLLGGRWQGQPGLFSPGLLKLLQAD